MKQSIFNYLFTYLNKNYLYNTFSTMLIELDNDVYISLENNRIDSIKKEYKDILMENKLIVDEGFDELAMFSYRYDSIRYGQATKSLNIIFLPTYSCNLACPYCFEGNNKENGVIDSNRIHSLIKFVNKKLNDEKQINKVLISYFGGEPLICSKIIEQLTSEISLICLNKNIEIYFDITTNLTLLDDNFLDVIKKNNIYINVTIDGPKFRHDKKRITRNGEGTYDKIMSNLMLLNRNNLRDLITIRINIDEDDLEYAEETYCECTKYSDNVYFALIKPYKGYNEACESRCIKDAECQAKTNTEVFNSIYRKYNKKNTQLFGRRDPCFLNGENTYVIDKDLDVYKCSTLVNHKECVVGKIDDEGNFIPNDNFYKQITYSPINFEKCRECKLLPFCCGGCPVDRYINEGMKNGIMECNCQETEKSLEEYLRNYIDSLRKEE